MLGRGAQRRASACCLAAVVLATTTKGMITLATPRQGEKEEELR